MLSTSLAPPPPADCPALYWPPTQAGALPRVSRRQRHQAGQVDPALQGGADGRPGALYLLTLFNWLAACGGGSVPWWNKSTHLAPHRLSLPSVFYTSTLAGWPGARSAVHHACQSQNRAAPGDVPPDAAAAGAWVMWRQAVVHELVHWPAAFARLAWWHPAKLLHFLAAALPCRCLRGSTSCWRPARS